jgi:hypothetical protein
MSSKPCAKCEKTVYPTEELKCLDKVSAAFDASDDMLAVGPRSPIEAIKVQFSRSVVV